MDAKQTAITMVASIALFALLGCISPDPLGPECVPEGQTIPLIAEPSQCCSGLSLILPKEANIVGIMGYCTAKCGNGTCDEIESNYNCPADCVAEAAGEQVIGPEAYSSEQEAFNALEGELEGLEEPSGQDLEALLGG